MTRVPDDPQALRSLAEQVATEAAHLVAAARAKGPVAAATKSSATDMVTEYDRASEALITERLRTARPDDAVLGEEGATAEGSTGIQWLIDPIDGTTNFLYGLAGFAVSVAARDEAGGLVGAVAVPATGELYSAARGLGATCNDQPMRCSDRADLATALVATGFSYDAVRRRHQAVRVSRIIEHVRDIRRFGAAAADLCYAASGRVDAYFEEFLNPWDLAAGEVIARESGCRVGSLDGGPLRPDSVLVAPPALFDALLALILAADVP